MQYTIRVESKESMQRMQTTMVEEFEDSQVFTAALKTEMKAKGVTSVSVDAITADTTATPKQAGKEGIVFATTTKEEKAAEFPWAAVLVTLCVVLIGVGVVILYLGNKKKKDVRYKAELEMVEQRNLAAMNTNPMHSSGDLSESKLFTLHL